MSTKTASAGASPALRWVLILAFALLAFFASYRFAIARNGVVTGAGAGSTAAASQGGCCGAKAPGAPKASGAATSSAAPVAGASGGCCGGGAGGPAVTKKAAVAGSVQKIKVDTSSGSYDPNTIELKAGVPAEITFTQSSGCLAQVQSQDLDFFEDLTAGPKTVKLGALKAGTYTFTCGMQMVSGTVVVK